MKTKYRIAAYIRYGNQRTYVPQYKLWWWPQWQKFYYHRGDGVYVSMEFDSESMAIQFIEKYKNDQKKPVIKVSYTYL